jgi:hypothetical protein
MPLVSQQQAPRIVQPAGAFQPRTIRPSSAKLPFEKKNKGKSGLSTKERSRPQVIYATAPPSGLILADSSPPIPYYAALQQEVQAQPPAQALSLVQNMSEAQATGAETLTGGSFVPNLRKSVSDMSLPTLESADSETAIASRDGYGHGGGPLSVPRQIPSPRAHLTDAQRATALHHQQQQAQQQQSQHYVMAGGAQYVHKKGFPQRHLSDGTVQGSGGNIGAYIDAMPVINQGDGLSLNARTEFGDIPEEWGTSSNSNGARGKAEDKRRSGVISPSHGLEYSRGGASFGARQEVDTVMAKLSRSIDVSASTGTTMPALPRNRQSMVSPVRDSVSSKEKAVPSKPKGSLARRGSKDSLSGSLMGSVRTSASASASSGTTAVKKKPVKKKKKAAK